MTTGRGHADEPTRSGPEERRRPVRERYMYLGSVGRLGTFVLSHIDIPIPNSILRVQARPRTLGCDRITLWELHPADPLLTLRGAASYAAHGRSR